MALRRFRTARTCLHPAHDAVLVSRLLRRVRLPKTPDFERVARWREACLAHPAAQQVTYDRIVKLYYDYAVGSGNGALPEGREVSSFTFDPDWPDRPMPPRDKYDRIATDAELGLI